MGNNNRSGILFIATCYDWMRPYTLTVMRQLWNPWCYAVIALEDARERSDFNEFPADRLAFFDYPKGWLAGKIFALWPAKVIAEIKQLVALPQIGSVLVLTIDTPLALFIPRLQHRIPVVNIIHDVRPHDRSFHSLRKRLFYKYFHKIPLQRLVARTSLQLTNALWQQRWLREHYPSHNVAYIPFPSLIDDTIASGNGSLKVLNGVGDYILFFGNVQSYKGVEVLVDAYASCPELHSLPLVIAGKGHLDMPVPDNIANKVIRIDSYIPDECVANLFRRAAVVVYPYIAATQSGVISLASYFGKPMVLSDIPYFREEADGWPGVWFATPGNSRSLAKTLCLALKFGGDTLPLYHARYDQDVWRKRYYEILDEFLTDKVSKRSR